MSEGNCYTNLSLVRPILNTFSRQVKGLNVCYLNARSIKSSIEKLRMIFEGSDVHVLVVSESWLSSSITSAFVSLSNFKLYRRDRDRNGMRGGGVAIYVHASLAGEILHSSLKDDVLEFLIVRVKNKHSAIAIGGIYCPPNAFSADNSSHLINSVNALPSDLGVLLCGDFNVNLSTTGPSNRELRRTFDCCGLVPINTLTTYNTCTNPSLIDMILVRSPANVIFHNQISPPSFLDHDILFTSVCFKFSPSRPLTYTFRNFRDISHDSLFSDCETLSWPPFNTSDSIDSQVDQLNSQILHLYDKHAPLCTRTLAPKSTPWITRSVRLLIQEREHLFRRYKRTKDSRDWERYRRLRNMAVVEIRAAKRKFFCSNLATNLPPKQLWSRIRNLGVCAVKDTSINFDSDEVNRHFCNSFASPSPTTLAHTASASFTAFSSDARRPFHFKSVSDADVVLAIASIKSNATGPDQINPRFLKIILPYAVSSLTSLFNSCIKLSYFPEPWRNAMVIPLPKKENPKLLSDLRPISILPFLSKVLERLLADQIRLFSSVPLLLSPYQSGFRSGHSCETALIDVSSNISRFLDAGHMVFLVLLDFSKAFDSVNHTLLLDKLGRLFNFGNDAVMLIRQFLTDRSQYVRIGDAKSTPRPVVSGVPQGSILGPLLFSLFINDAPSCLKSCKFHLYADDLQLYCHCRPDEAFSCAEKVNSDLEALTSWSAANQLLLNPSKSVPLLIKRRGCSPDTCSVLPRIVLSGEHLEFVDRARNLGVVMNSRFTCCDFVAHTIAKIYGALRVLRTSGPSISTHLRRKLAITLIVPHFLFGFVVFPKLDAICERRLNVAFNDVMRYVWGVPRSQSVSHLIPQFVGLSRSALVQARALTLLFKIKTGCAPSYLSSHLPRLGSTRTGQFQTLATKSSIGDRSFFAQTIRWWNELPPNILSAPSLCSFQALLNAHLATK